MSSLFLKIVNMSITASWLILAVILLRVVLKKAPKWINVLLWGIVAFRLICPFNFESALSLIPSKETIPLDIGMDTTPAINSGINAINNAVNPIISQSNTPVAGASANPLQITIGLFEYIWILGIVVMLIYAAVSYFRLQKKVGASLHLRNNIWIYDGIQTPFILGTIKPRIYIPSGTDEAQLPYIIAHENAHLKRRDQWWKPLGFLVLAIHWFNPLVWVAYILLCRDIELACDEKVIRDLNQSESISYSEALLSCSVNRRTVMVCPIAFGEVGVKERVKRVLNYKKPAFWIVVVAVAASIVLGVCYLTNPSSCPVELDSIQISEASTMDLRTNSKPTTSRLSISEIDELSSRVKDLKVGRQDQDLQGHTPFYSLYVDTEKDGRITFSGFNSDGSHTAVLYDDAYYRITDSDFISYLQRICSGETRSEANRVFQAEILEIHDGYYLVEPVESSWELSSADRIEVPIRNATPSPEPEVGDIIEIEYSGDILESYPAQIANVYDIKIVNESDITENDLLEAFHLSIATDEEVLVTGYVYAGDGAYGLDGVVQYADESGCPWKLAYIHDGIAIPVSQNWDSHHVIVGELMYLGNGVVKVYVENTDTGILYECTMAYSYDEDARNTHFESVSNKVNDNGEVIYKPTPIDRMEANYKNEEFVITKLHYENLDGEWVCGEYTYKYKLEITGRLNNAAKNSTYIVLSNTENITFDQTWKASGFSSLMTDYFDPSVAVIVGNKLFS